MEVTWKFEPIDGQELFENASKARTLIKNECCNYDSGNCVLLDNGVYHKCPQMTADKIICGWFVKAVLPLDKILEVKINGIKEDTQKKCAECGKSFVPVTNRSKYCKKCSGIKYNQQKIANQRKRRSMKPFRANL